MEHGIHVLSCVLLANLGLGTSLRAKSALFSGWMSWALPESRSDRSDIIWGPRVSTSREPEEGHNSVQLALRLQGVETTEREESDHRKPIDVVNS